MDETNGISLPTLSNYKLGKTLGAGAFGKVKVATHILSGIKVAIKILDRKSIDETGGERVRREIEIMKFFSHPHIVKLFEVIETQTKLYLVMEYMNRGELFKYITEQRWLEEDQARRFFQQIISGVEGCHLHGVAHRDIKPENLLLDSKGNVKVADFGLANVMRDGRLLKTWCGSLNYAAPEVVSRRPYAGPEVDVWSCGVVLYALLSGYLPFDHGMLPVLCEMIKNGIFTFPKCFSPGACDLIKRMLTVNPVKRITIPEIYKHPWFQVDLLRYIADHSLNTSCNATKVDVRVLVEMNNLGFNVQEVNASLNNMSQNQTTVSYCILLHRRLNNNRTSHVANLLGSLPSEGTYCRDIYVRPVFPDQGKWAFGFESCSSPHETMRDVLTVFKRLNVQWKKIGAYNFKCLWKPSVERYSLPNGMNRITLRQDNCVNEAFKTSNNETFNVVKFEIQLYKDSA
ncbi:SNF1-related protein kinase catalytic subunit alpha KIN10-like [Bidens hawaiensis]|uniref:SNF1-related protein kinase catalytic subunit alpha KIN10-like n=1 Tax=Bidens hawaiensis TaxID=980011 RepID=UPI004049DADF